MNDSEVLFPVSPMHATYVNGTTGVCVCVCAQSLVCVNGTRLCCADPLQETLRGESAAHITPSNSETSSIPGAAKAKSLVGLPSILVVAQPSQRQRQNKLDGAGLVTVFFLFFYERGLG